MYDDDITYNFYHNEHPDTVLIQLRQWVSRRVNRDACKYFYVGQTNNPSKRFLKHQNRMSSEGKSEWDSMDVIYGHRSLGYVTQVENALIGHLKNHAKWDEGGLNYAGARYDGAQEYKVYLLLDATAASDKDWTTRKHTVSQKLTAGQDTRGMSTQMRHSMIEANFDKAVGLVNPKSALRALYVGYTNDADRRFYEHQYDSHWKYGGDHWDRMEVLYKTGSLDRALAAESTLIEYARANFPEECQNGPARDLDDGRLPYSYIYYLEECD